MVVETQVPVDVLVRGGPVVTMNEARQVHDPGYVAVKDGRVVAVGDARDCNYAATRRIDVPSHAIMPGLINCHTHLTNGLYRGLYDELPLADWLEQGLWPVLRAATAESRYAGAALSIAENLLGGVTTVVVGEFGGKNSGSIDGVLRAVRESGIRAIVSRVAVDSADDTDPSQATPLDLRENIAAVLQDVDRLRDQFNSPLLSVVPEPLGVLRCTPDMIQAMSEYARNTGCRMTMHVSSSEHEINESIRRYGRSPIAQLDALGALGDYLSIAHCVWPTEHDIERLASTGTGVSHNPVANLMYAVGVAPLVEMIDAGVRVGLGTDGSSTNNGQNLWETMKMAIFLQKQRKGARWGSGELALELATIGGASVISSESTLGSIEVGKRADLISVEMNGPSAVPRHTWPSNLVYAQGISGVRYVLVDGKVVVDDGRLTAWDLDDVLGRANEGAAYIEDATGLASKFRARSRWTWPTSD